MSASDRALDKQAENDNAQDMATVKIRKVANGFIVNPPKAMPSVFLDFDGVVGFLKKHYNER